MPVLRRVVKPTTQRGKRALLNKEPKLIENDKKAVFIKGHKTSLQSLQCLKDFAALKKPDGVLLGRKNDMLPFEDVTKLERLARNYDSSLFAFASHNKKRPDNIILGRTYDQHLLDMIEMGIESFKSLQEFKVEKIACGTKPILIFSGEAFDRQHEYQRLKCLLFDFFGGPKISAVRLIGLEHVIMFTAIDGKIYMKSYKILMKKSGVSTPRIELEEIGPSAEFTLRRSKLASEDLYKLSRKQPVELKKKQVKNISRTLLGSKLGRVHMQKQNLKRLQTRKMKGLKKTKAEKKLRKKKTNTES
ncbi:rRNA-binding ribosome biosynthesis protein rpf2 [Chamberlinius hualienensis]